MTDPTPPSPPTRVGNTFDNTGVWLPGLAVESLRLGKLVLDGYTFTNCVIDGPAVLAVVDAVTFRSCDFGRIGAASDLLFTPRGQHLTGAIGFSNTRFVNCRFDMVGFTGNEEFLRAFEANLATRSGDDA